MKHRSAVSLLVAALATLPAAAALTASPAAAAPTAATTSTACTATKTCLKATRTTVGLQRGYDAVLTCATAGSVTSGVRIYLSNGNYATAPRTISCVPGSTYAWHTDFSVSTTAVKGFAAVITAPVSVTGAYIGTAVPPGDPIAVPFGFSWN